MSRQESPIHIFHGEKKGRQRFARSPIEGTESSILMEPGKEVVMRENAALKTVRAARSFATARDRIDFWVNRYRNRGKDLVNTGNTYEWFRGIGNVSEKGEDAGLIPTRKNVRFDPELLRNSLGDNFDKYFSEAVQVIVDTRAGVTGDSIAKTLSRKLSRLGIAKKNQLEILSVQTVLKAKDSEALFRAIDRGDIKLPPGAVEYDLILEPKLLPQKREELPKAGN